MNGIGYFFAAIVIILAFAAPKRYGLVAILIGATLIPRSQELAIGPLHFGVVRLAVLTGLLRVLVKGERIVGRLHTLDRLMIVWGIWYVGSSAFHNGNSAVTRFGEIYTDLGIYFLCRIFLQDANDIILLFKTTCFLFIPVAISMMKERMTGTNYFAMIFSDPASTDYRNGKYRAHGPFAHAISAGTVGAVGLPMALYLWRQERKIAVIGLLGTAGIVYASGSSGPFMTAFTILGALAIWRIRDRLRAIRWLAVFAIIALDLVMSDPVYFLLAKIDITGGSTGYYRAVLIQGAIRHFSEWWMVGTDYTKNWAPGGEITDPNNTDITNEFIQMGVTGGLVLMLLFISVIFAAFKAIGRILKLDSNPGSGDPYLAWVLGATLFGHVATFFSVSYFDIAIATYFYLLLGIIGALYAISISNPPMNPDGDHAS